MTTDSLTQLEKLVTDVRADYAKATSGNKSASVRVRKAMSEIKKAAQDIRVAMVSAAPAAK